MEKLNIYNYSSPRHFLTDCYQQKKALNPQFSIRSWAKQMNCSHAQLSMLLQGKRSFRPKHMGLFSKGLSLSSQEQLYLQALIQYEAARTPEERELCSLWLSELHPGDGFKYKEIEEYQAISDWIHPTILAMTELREFDGKEESIQKKLREELSLTKIKSAIERLLELDLLQKNPEGQLSSTFKKTSTKEDIVNHGARKYCKDTMDLAKKALDEIAAEKREFSSFAFSIDESKIPLAKKMIRRFREQLVKHIGSESGDHVYQMNMQFFQLTEDSSDKKSDKSNSTGPAVNERNNDNEKV